VYIWDSSIEEYVDQDDPKRTFSGPGLSRILGVVTKVIENGEWVGRRCGEPIR
jgi:hypothetical protein